MQITALPDVGSRDEFRVVLGDWGLRAQLADGRLRELWPGVLVPRHRVFDPMVRASAALRYAGPEAALTGRTAAWLQGCAAASSPTVHVLVPYSRWVRSQQGLVVHHGRTIAADVVRIQELRVVALEAAITGLLCTDSQRTALALADQAAAQLPATDRAEFCARIADRLAARPDRRGTVRAAGLLDLVTGKADSPPESWLRLLVVETGFPPPVMQYEVVDLHGRVRWILDQCWPELRIALEYDGHEAHEDRQDEDAARDTDLERRGWVVIHVRAGDLQNPERFLRKLWDAYRRRSAA